MQNIASFAACTVIVLSTVACNQAQLPEQQIADASKSHASRILPMTGQSESDVVRALGAPTEFRDSEFESPRYGVPKVPPETDRQLIFRRSMQHTLVYFSKGKVVAAVLEWSDY